MHSGKWDEANCYVDYVIQGVVFRENASFTELYNIIATQLAVDVTVKVLKIEYKVDQSSTRTVIHNEMGVRNSEHCESSTTVASGIFGSLCITGFEEFEKQKLTVAEIVNPLDTFQMENCSVVITDPSHKYVKVFPSTEYVHNVNDKGRNYIVCLKKKRCTYGSFQYEEIPCEHAWAILKFKSLRPDELCSNLYTPTTVLKTYGFPIYPLPDKTEWVVPGYIMTDLVLPPEFKRPPRRPRKMARDKSAREMFESKGTNTCSTCGIAGHNRRSCRNQPREV
ncbi:hypothetical protein KY290_007150 [Solanum tuberosum]|uniref:SWIM-type domain-containing protein n=1 Tax=Solanum tuberosum TaxID=4113 RepID=A0ABQ7W6P0_SOLTU|nr:hypothetical protein KY290_007150 [Solanum tuberosum]